MWGSGRRWRGVRRLRNTRRMWGSGTRWRGIRRLRSGRRRLRNRGAYLEIIGVRIRG
jgi:hypothetical protein